MDTLDILQMQRIETVACACTFTNMAADTVAVLENADNHQSVKLAKEVNWLKVWDAARDCGHFWTGIVQGFTSS